MIITRDPQYLIKQIMLYGIVTILCCLPLFGFDISSIGLPVYLSLLLPIIVLMPVLSVAYGRTFVLDSQGCTVCFLWLRKKYLWDELLTKRIGAYPKLMLNSRGECPYRRGATFAPFRFRHSRYISPKLYSILYPWSFVYINLHIPDPVICGSVVRYPGRYYEADEQEFREKMKQWHVELEEWNT